MRAAALGLALMGCAGGETAPVPPTPVRVQAPRMEVPADNPVTAEKAELGRMLFHDPILSSDRAVACVTCHGQIWGFSDGLRYSIGVGGSGPAGTGRVGPTHTRRNSSTLWNVGYRAALFWDGRARTLEEQVTGPMNDPIELGRPPADVARDLRAIPAYVALFRRAFPGDAEPVTERNLARAIATFERTLVSFRARYDRYRAGDDGALDATEHRGLALFEELRCGECHAPPFFDRERYDPSLTTPTEGAPDDGRMEHTRDASDRGRFLVPTLRNLRESQPYFHDGSVATVHDAIALEAAGRPGGRRLNADELAALVAFVRDALIDTSTLSVIGRPETVPSGLSVPQDGYRIPR